VAPYLVFGRQNGFLCFSGGFICNPFGDFWQTPYGLYETPDLIPYFSPLNPRPAALPSLGVLMDDSLWILFVPTPVDVRRVFWTTRSGKSGQVIPPLCESPPAILPPLYRKDTRLFPARPSLQGHFPFPPGCMPQPLNLNEPFGPVDFCGPPFCLLFFFPMQKCVLLVFFLLDKNNPSISFFQHTSNHRNNFTEMHHSTTSPFSLSIGRLPGSTLFCFFRLFFVGTHRTPCVQIPRIFPWSAIIVTRSLFLSPLRPILRTPPRSLVYPSPAAALFFFPGAFS